MIWIDPNKVRRNVENLRSRRAKHVGRYLEAAGWIDRRMKGGFFNLFYRNQFLIEDKDFTVKGPVAEMRTSVLMADFVNHLDNPADTMLYRQYLEQIAASGYARHKRTVFRDASDVDAFFRRYLLPLYESLKTDGYDPERSPDRCKCYVAADGEIMQGENGRHRLALARLIGIRKFPFVVFGVHENWYRTTVGDHADFTRLASEIRKLEARYR